MTAEQNAPARGGRGARKRILDAAAELFYREGINATGVDRLAEAASVSKRTLYQHFPSKSAVVEEYLRTLEEHIADPVNPRPRDVERTPRERLLALFERRRPPGRLRGCPFHNAAVEAARAGEQGRGFAVVAGEVRSLAQRSAEAAREIKALIGASVERVEVGTRLVQDAGGTMGEIVASVQRVSDIIGEISSASREQTAGIAQVADAVNQMDQGTQSNAALVEETAAAAESLSSQANQLAQSVAAFKIAHSSR